MTGRKNITLTCERLRRYARSIHYTSNTDTTGYRTRLSRF